MIAFNRKGGATAAEQQSLLESKNFSLRSLSTQGHLDVGQVFLFSLQPSGVFLFSATILALPAFRYGSEGLIAVVHAIGLAVLLGMPAIALGTLVFGIAMAKLHSRVRWSAVFYWTWWPFLKLVLFIAAAVLGTMLGNYLWVNKFYPYTRLGELQAYQNVDPARVSGVRLQDAGVVSFSDSAGVDRTRTGCLQNRVTYCVAPIVPDGQISEGADRVPHKRYDLFMAGVDCCSCPGEFRCGDWRKARQPGGLRVIDERSSFFQLAADDWAATHGKEVGHPVFFEWVDDSVDSFKGLYSEGLRLLLVALLTVPSACLVLAAVLNGVLRVLLRLGVVAPLETPLPTRGLAALLGGRAQQELQGDGKYVIL